MCGPLGRGENLGATNLMDEKAQAGPSIAIWRDLPEILACPTCGKGLTLDTTVLECSCGAKYPIVRGIPRFVASEEYVDNFGFEWTEHSKTQLDGRDSNTTEKQFREEMLINPEEMRGKLVLDAGCGMGRYAEVASRYGARVVGIDLSRAVEAARQNLADRENVQILQANILKLPFAKESFDYIYSIGVLHHTPDCEASFRGLVKLLKPGGRITIWLYQGYNRTSYRLSDLYRKVTTRMPNRLLHALCYVSVPLYYVDVALNKMYLRPLAQVVRIALPISHHPDARWRVLDTFDWYSPKYQSKHTYEQVFRWFESEGLVNNRVLRSPIGVSGQKPAR
jgi:SAM-dependent methyltransferase